MTSGGPAPARGARTAAWLLAALMAGTIGHVAAGGTWTGHGIAVAAALLLGPSWLMTTREQRLPALIGLLAAGQTATHLTLTITAPHAGHAAGLPSAPMLGAHLAATLALAWWIRRGERRLWDRVLRIVLSWHGIPRISPLRPVPGFGAVLPARTAVLRHCLVLRGPPAA